MSLLDLTIGELLPLKPEYISRLVENDLPIRHFREVEPYGLSAGLPDDLVDHFLRESVKDDGAGGLVVSRRNRDRMQRLTPPSPVLPLAVAPFEQPAME